MAGPMTTGSFPRSLVPGIRKEFGRGYNMGGKEYAQIFDKVNSDRAYEEYGSATGFGPAQAKAEGSSVIYDEDRQSFTTRGTNVTMSLGFQCTMEAKADSKFLPQVPKDAKSLGKSFANAKENVGALVLSRAFDSNYVGGDGKELCATDHPNKDGTTYSNELATAADLSESKIEQLVDQIWTAENERGLTISLNPKCLIVPTASSWNAHRILKSVLQNDTANNAINALRDKGIIPEVVMNRYFAEGDGRWFIKTDTDCGLMYQERSGMVFAMDGDSDTFNTKFTGYERYTFLWANPMGLYGSAGAA